MYKNYTRVFLVPYRHMLPLLPAIGTYLFSMTPATRRKVIMRLNCTAFLLLITLLQVSAAGFAQKLTYSKQNVTLSEIFREIKRQTGYNVVYSDQKLNDSKKITVSFDHAGLKEVLEECLRDQAVDYMIEEKTIVIREKKDSFIDKVIKVLTPPIDIHGKVTDSLGTPLIGAAIKVKGTEIGTTTNARGEFFISGVDESKVLVVSYIGYKTQEVLVSLKVNVVMKGEVGKLTEVSIVSTGYQQLPKERATGSFSKLDNNRLNEQTGTNILDRLPAIANSYAVTSPRVNSNGYITLRGFSTLNGPRNPLIVLDNFPYEGDINNINPNDVESISFLKDAAAASIWGTRAGNGVVVITTKKGSFNQPVKIDISSNVTTAGEPDLFARKTISSADFIEVEKALFENKYRFSDTSALSHPSFSPVYEILFQRQKGDISSEEAADQIDRLKGRDVRNDYLKYIYQRQINQQYALAFQGGSPNLAWRVSAGYDKNKSQLDEKYTRLNLRADNTYNINKKVVLTTALYYTYSTNGSGRPAYGSISTGNGWIPPYSSLADEDGNPVKIYQRRQIYVDSVGGGKLLDWNYYPLEDYRHSIRAVRSIDMLANAGLKYQLLKGLSAGVKVQYERQSGDTEFLQDAYSYYTRDLINNFSKLNNATGAVSYVVPRGDILDLTESVFKSYNIRGQVNYDKRISDHEFAFLAGAEVKENRTSSNTYRTYGLDQDILTIGAVDYVNQYPQLTTGINSFVPNPANFDETKNRFVSVFTNAAYTYMSRYTLSASARRDASNIFGVATNDKWRPLWSTGMSWNLSDEPFYKLSFLPYLKLRMTYGYSGNVDPSRTAMTTIKYYSSLSPYTQSPMTAVDRFYNPDLRWEKVGMFNIGTDFNTEGKRVSGSVEYYRKNAKDLYGNVPVDMTLGLGVTTMVKNVAEIKGSGLDVELNSQNLINGEFKWTSNLNLSVYRDKVGKSYTSDLKGSNLVGGGITGLEGKPLYALLSYKWRGLNPSNGDPIGYINGHNSANYAAITGDSTQLSDLAYNGSLVPTLYGSLGNTFTWKKFSLTARISYAFGHYFRKESINYGELISSGTGHSDFALRWQNQGDELVTNVPSWVYPVNSARDSFYNNSEVLVEKGDNIRLQYVNLSFDLSDKKRHNSGLQKIRIFCTASNLGLLWRANKAGLDPDYPNSFNPPSKSFSIGINAGL